MKRGDLVQIKGKMINTYTYALPYLGIYLNHIPWNHPSYSPSFPMCEILTPSGVKLIKLERIFPVCG